MVITQGKVSIFYHRKLLFLYSLIVVDLVCMSFNYLEWLVKETRNGKRKRFLNGGIMVVEKKLN